MKFSSLVPSVLAATGVAVMMSVIPAEAAVFGFNNITNNNPSNVDVANQLTVDVTGDDNTVNFKFSNTGSIEAFIAQVYFDDDTSLLSNLSINNFAGVSFSEGGSPPNLPGGNSISPSFDSDFRASADQPGSGNDGVDLGEMLGIEFAADIDDVLSGLQAGSLRIGMHVQGIGNSDKSDSFVNDPTPVPEPLTILGSATALGIGGLLKREQSKKNNKNKA